MVLQVTSITRGEVTILRLKGDLTAGAGAETLQAALDKAKPDVVLNLSEVNDIDIKGIVTLTNAQAESIGLGGCLLLSSLNRNLHTKLVERKLGGNLPSFRNEASAVAFIQGIAGLKSIFRGSEDPNLPSPRMTMLEHG